jgi:predicted membrane-bound spermidine synthase
MAQFAVTAAMVSIVLSAFMVGLGVGSWGAGKLLRRRVLQVPALRLYAAVEFLIGLSAFAVPWELSLGRNILQHLEAGHPFPPPLYYLLAGLCIGIAMVPWCACMGATFPLAMAAIRERLGFEAGDSERSFSYLYLANVLGALAGTGVPLLLIEELGFKGTLGCAAALNLLLALSAFRLSLSEGRRAEAARVEAAAALPRPVASRWPYVVLFGTGLTSMACEVVWIRLFTPGLGTMVYAFATILGLYLCATYMGSRFYRKSKSYKDELGGLLFAVLGLSVLLPLLMCDPRISLVYQLRVFSILPFSFIVGWITPMMIDRIAQGDPDRAGRGYAVNIAGCVLGPLISGFLLLPWIGERYALLVCALPWMVVAFLPAFAPTRIRYVKWKESLACLLGLAMVVGTRDFESTFIPRETLRDSTATVTAVGSTKRGKYLLVNGVSMTSMTPVTKMIVHLPLAFLPHSPQSVLVICFGMGTTYRSALSWGISSTAVELVPSVVKFFPYFHSDANQLLASPLSHVMIDDGRSYLQRSRQQYDVIVIDPPPPVEAAASSLLYSKEFYAIARKHLRSGGILQQWLPVGAEDPAIIAAAARALKESFPHVRAFKSVEGWGYHFLASDSPIENYSAENLAAHLPPAASADLVEWGPYPTPEQMFARVLSQEASVDELIHAELGVPALDDDRPVNEYFLVRRFKRQDYWGKLWARFRERV